MGRASTMKRSTRVEAIERHGQFAVGRPRHAIHATVPFRSRVRRHSIDPVAGCAMRVAVVFESLVVGMCDDFRLGRVLSVRLEEADKSEGVQFVDGQLGRMWTSF